MRITKKPITVKELEQIKEIVDNVMISKDFTLSVDFACDVYALFKEEFSKRSILKSQWDIFTDVKKLYSMYRVGNLMENYNFYMRIKNYLKFFIFSKLFSELNKLNPMEATEYFLKMFKPKGKQEKNLPPEKEQQQVSAQQDTDEEEDDSQEEQDASQGQPHESPSGDSDDNQGLSADEDNLPIDMGEFKMQMPKIEKAIESGILDRDDMKNFVQKKAGVGANQIHIGNISEIVKKMSQHLSQKDLEIFYLARQKEMTEIYRRDEVLDSVLFPDNEMSIKDMDSQQEVLKVIPSQYAVDDDVFAHKLAKKELQVRDYQSRKLKKQALYLLIDVSQSMSGASAMYASSVGVALVRQAVDDGATYFLRFFDGQTKELHRVETKKEAEKMVDVLMKQPYSGGGTSISGAILTAVDDIKKDPQKFDKMEILVITDGEDHVGLDKEHLQGIKLHSTVILGSNHGLKNLGDSYRELTSRDFSN